MKLENKKKFWYGTPAYTGSFRALHGTDIINKQFHKVSSVYFKK
jgi:hypothetical protein